MSAVVMSKGRLVSKTLGPRRIAVNVVAPGATETDFSGGIVRDNPAVNKRVAGGTALGRAGVPDDIGRMIASLLSEENRWINAERIEVARAGPNSRYFSSPGLTGLTTRTRCSRMP